METEKGGNWLVFVIDSEVNSLEFVLSSIWKIPLEHNLLIAHFRYCARYGRVITYSIRGYLDKSELNQNQIVSSITMKLEELKNEENQLKYYFEGSRFDEFQK